MSIANFTQAGKNINNMFSKVYVVNMKKRTEKKRLMEFKLERIGITDYIFFEGIDGSCSSLNNAYSSVKTKKIFTSRGAFGLIMTYIELLKDIYQHNYEEVLILEDDVNIHRSYKNLLNLFSSTIRDKNYDIVWLGANQTRMTKKQFTSVINHYKYEPEPAKSVFTYGTFSIILKRSAVVKMINRINKENIEKLKPIDAMLNDMISDNTLKGVVCYPYVFMPDVTDSDNMGQRDQIEFSLSRGFIIDDYYYILQSDYTDVSKFIKIYNISLEKFKGIVSGSDVTSKTLDYSLKSQIDRIVNFAGEKYGDYDDLERVYKLLI